MSSKEDIRKPTNWNELPEEIWIDILNRLRLTDLVLLSQTCTLLKNTTSACIDRYDRHQSPFTKNSYFSQDGVPIEPDIYPESGLAACFDEITSTLKLIKLCDGSEVASSPLTNAFPVSIKFSQQANFIAACFDSSVRFYSIDIDGKRLIPCREVRFDVRILDFIPPGYQRCRYGMGRMLVSFSKLDNKLAVAHILETLEPPHCVTIKCLTASLQGNNTDVIEQVVDFERLHYSLDSQETTTIRLRVNREFVSFWDIRMNADPLCFLIPPGCIHESGFLLDPKRSKSLSSHRINQYDGRWGSLLMYCFSACGQYYFESRRIPRGVRSCVSIAKFDLSSQLVVRMDKLLIDDMNTVLEVMISKDCQIAVVVMGTITSSSSEISTWYVVNLLGEGHVRVQCKEPIFSTHYEDFDRAFGLSDDGQLLSISLDSKSSDGHCLVKVYETATGLDVDSLTCSAPRGGDLLQANWHNTRKCGCSHFFGGDTRKTLTMFASCDTGVSFSHAN